MLPLLPISSERKVLVHLGTPLLRHLWGPEWLWVAGACPAGGPEGLVTGSSICGGSFQGAVAKGRPVLHPRKDGP